MSASAFTSGLVGDAVLASMANLTCLSRALQHDAAVAPAGLLFLPLAAVVVILPRCASEEPT
jgi:hypothetical protein